MCDKHILCLRLWRLHKVYLRLRNNAVKLALPRTQIDLLIVFCGHSDSLKVLFKLCHVESARWGFFREEVGVLLRCMNLKPFLLSSQFDLLPPIGQLLFNLPRLISAQLKFPVDFSPFIFERTRWLVCLWWAFCATHFVRNLAALASGFLNWVGHFDLI